jgi:hypothetical protein
MRRYTQPGTVRSALHRITIIPGIVMTHLTLIFASEVREPTTHLVFDADTQAVTSWATTRRVRVRDAGVVFVALIEICTTSATDWMGVGW